MPNVLLSTKAAGDIVTLKVSGSPRNFIVAQQGRPASGNYDTSFDNVTLLLMQDIYDQRQWDGSANDYANSSIHSWLNNEASGFLSLLDADIRAVIPTVKIPYRPGSGTSSSVSSGANGLACKAFLLSMLEVGLSPSYSPSEGATLTYFTSGGNARRIANYNGSPSIWWTRSPSTNNSYNACVVRTDGTAGSSNVDYTYGCRPALPLPSNLYVSDDGSILTNEPPTAPGSISVSGVVASGTATITLTAATDPDGTIASYRYERSVDSGNWTQFADVNSLTQTDSVSGDWGTVAYRACAVDNAGEAGPYATSDTKTVNSGWVTIGGPDSALGQRIKPFTLSATVNVTGATGTPSLTVTCALDGKQVSSQSLTAGSEASIFVDTRVLATGQHTIQMTAEASDYLPANKAWQFSVPMDELPDGGRAEQPRDAQGNPIFFRTTSQQVIGKNGLSVQNELDNMEKRFRGLTGHLEPVDAVLLGTAGAQTELPRESGVHYCFGVYSSAGNTDFTMVLVPAGINTASTLDGNVGVTPSADKFTVVLNGSNAAIVQYFKFVTDAEANVTTNPVALFTALDQPHVLSASGGTSTTVTDQTDALQTIIDENPNANYYILEDTDGNKYYVASSSIINASTASFTGPCYQDDQATTLYSGRTLNLVNTSDVPGLFTALPNTVYSVTTQGTPVSIGSNLNETLLAMIEVQPTWNRYKLNGSGGTTYYVLSQSAIGSDATSAASVCYCTDGGTYYTGGTLLLLAIGNVGDIMTFAGQQWIISHKTASEAYLTLQGLSGKSSWNNLDGTCQTWENSRLSSSQKAILKTITAGNTSGKVFVATKAQMNGGFSYFNSNSRRNLDKSYWTSTKDGSFNAWCVLTDGSIESSDNYFNLSSSIGFRPSICIDLTAL